MKPTILIAMAASLAMGACTPKAGQPQDTAGQAPPPVGDGCSLSSLNDLVGKPFTPALEADARARAKVRSVRAIRPGMAVTMDFRPDRLNIDIDGKNVVTGFRCG